MDTHDGHGEDDAGATIHEVWVKRIVVLEETVCIPIEVLREEVADVKESVQVHKRRLVARKRAMAHAEQMLTNGTWKERAHVEELVVGDLKVAHTSADMLAD